jgi:MFS family permease
VRLVHAAILAERLGTIRGATRCDFNQRAQESASQRTQRQTGPQGLCRASETRILDAEVTLPMKYETRLIWVLTITFGFVFFDRNATNFLMPFIADDLHFSNGQIGLVASALSFTWAIAGFLGGAYSDRTGNRKGLLLVSVVAFSLCSFISGLAASFIAMFCTRLLMGLAEGPILPIAQSLVALESSAAKRGNNMGVMQNFGSNFLGSFVAPLVLVAIASTVSWRWAFYLSGVPGLIMAVLIAKYVHQPAAVTHPPGLGAPTLGAPLTQNRMSYARMIAHRNMWLCMLMAIFMVAWMVLGWAFLPIFYTKFRHLDVRPMSILMSVLGLSAAFFSFIVPALSDRFGRRPIIVLFNFIGLLVPLAALYFEGSLVVLGALVFLGWSASGTFPLFMGTVPSETIPARYVATSLGLVAGLGEVLGGVGAPAIAGRVADEYGLQAPMLMMAACAILGTLLAFFLRETAPNRVQMTTSEHYDNAEIH